VAINFDDYLITFHIAFNRNLRRSVNRAVERMNKTPEDIAKNLRRIRVTSLEGGRLPITFRVNVDVSPAKWKKLGNETIRLRDDLFARGGSVSGLGERVDLALAEIYGNVVSRFNTAGLDIITGQLAETIDSQQPIGEEYETTGIRAAIGHIPELNAGTPPYNIDSKTGEVTPRAVTRDYNYSTATGQNVPVSGYWAFQEFGTSNGVMPRAFLLEMDRAIHQEDDAAMRRVNKWLASRIAEYNNRAREIMS